MKCMRPLVSKEWDDQIKIVPEEESGPRLSQTLVQAHLFNGTSQSHYLCE